MVVGRGWIERPKDTRRVGRMERRNWPSGQHFRRVPPPNAARRADVPSRCRPGVAGAAGPRAVTARKPAHMTMPPSTTKTWPVM